MRLSKAVLTGGCMLLMATPGGLRPAPAPPSASVQPKMLRVCADPNNLPFSNRRGEGFENQLASLIARELGAEVSYTWWAQRRGFIRNTLNAGQCDVLMGVPSRLEQVETTSPYYRSMYVLIAKRARQLHLRSLDDPQLRHLRLGVQMIGDDGANTPPAHALSARGIVTNVVGYPVYGDYSQPNPPAAIVSAVAKGQVDAAVVWGPLAGYFAHREREPIDLSPIDASRDDGWPLAFDISMAVRRGDSALKETLDAVLRRKRAAVSALLEQYAIPRVERVGDFSFLRATHVVPRDGW